MKTILIIILSLFYSVIIYADCAGSGLWMFPKSKNITQNSIFVLTGYANSQKIILELNNEHAIYLKSGNIKINLIVSEINVGQFELTQAVLKPEKELEMGVEYTVFIDDLPDYEKLNRYSEKLEEFEPITFQVTLSRDTVKPILYKAPIELKKTLIHYGCGPSTFVVFSNSVTENNELIIKTKVKSIKTNKINSYFIEPYKNTISIGHGMCSGAFDFIDGNEYEVEFSYMDSSGNLTTWIGETIRFTKPTIETINDED